MFETKDEIEEVNRKLLEKLLDENEFVAVYFCKFLSDDDNLSILIQSYFFHQNINRSSNGQQGKESYNAILLLPDEDNCVECDEAIEGLEKIDDETDALDITMVKVNDARYAKKYGVNKMPALVYFRRKFPSIYRDNLFDEDTILEWLTSNRFTENTTLEDVRSY